jgi:chromosomal replication initiator protein
MWNRIVDELKKTNSEGIINAFIKPLFSVKENREKIVVGCPSEQILQILEKQGWITQIKNLATHLFEKNTEVEFIVKHVEIEENEIQIKFPFNGNKKAAKEKLGSGHIISSDFTFDNFVSGPSNQTVYAASQGIAKNPGTNYNPFFIYGDSGLGKTHIIQAIANYVIKNKNMSVCYMTAKQLMMDYIASLSDNSSDKFRGEIIKYDMLLIDDIQFLSKKAGTQEEFFNIFNSYHTQGKQIVLTSDRYPSEIKDIDKRLVSRFIMGVTLDIKPPEYETRLAIVLKKAELFKIRIDDETAKFVAVNLKNNVRELEGALKTLQISSELMGINTIYKSFAEDILKDMIKKKVNLGPDQIIKMTATYLNVKVSEITSEKRSKQISLSRQIAMYLVKKYTSSTLKDIGDIFGGRNHATVISSISKVEFLLINDTNIKKIIEKLEREIEESINVF